MLPYVRIRDAVFTSAGFNVRVSEAAPGGLKRDSNAHFIRTNDAGKAVGLERIGGCEGLGEAECFVQLQSYRSDPAQAEAIVLLLEARLGAVVKGHRQQQEECGYLLAQLVFAEAKYARDDTTRLGLLAALYGTARVHEELNRRGTLDALQEIDLADLVAEAYYVRP
jgi:hypothetical protein